MSDTLVQECKYCHQGTDCIHFVCQECSLTFKGVEFDWFKREGERYGYVFSQLHFVTNW